MGANQSRQEIFVDAEEGDDEYQDAPVSFESNLRSKQVLSATTNINAPRLYKHTLGKENVNRWILASKSANWKFTKIKEREECGDDEDEGKYYDADSSPRRNADVEFSWYLVIDNKVKTLVDDKLAIRFNDKELRVDFVANNSVWALRFSIEKEYTELARQYRESVFENVHQVKATEQNKTKVLGKDFVASWDQGEDVDTKMWEAEEDFRLDSSEDDKKGNSVRETHKETPQGKTAVSLTMGALERSFVIHNNGIDVYSNKEDGFYNEGLTVDLFGARDRGGSRVTSNPYVTPKKGLLVKGESNMLLFSPNSAPSSKYTSSDKLAEGLSQLDLGTGKVVANWRFEKDGTPITMRDLTNDTKSSQLDSTHQTFLGLDDNRLCRWDMRDKHGVVQNLAGGGSPSPSPVLTWAEGHQFSRGTNFRCFATTGDGCVAVGARDGKVRLYSTTSMRQAKTAFPGLGSPITHIDVTYDGRWVLATTDSYLILISTMYTDKDGREKCAFTSRMGSQGAAPRFLKLNPVDAQQALQIVAGGGSSSSKAHQKFQGARFSWVTEGGRQERHVVATWGNFSVIWNFRRVKQSGHPCYNRLDGGPKVCYCYKVVPRDESVVESKFMHDSFTGSAAGEAPLVVATSHVISSYDV